MNFQGVVMSGTIVFENQVQLPEGAKVIIRLQESTQVTSPLAEMLLKHAGKAEGLPDNLAAQHDHYLYGTPKK